MGRSQRDGSAAPPAPGHRPRPRVGISIATDLDDRAAKEFAVRIGLHLSDFTYPSGPAGLADDLTRVVTVAEEAGFARVSVMDHLWQISVHGPPENDMLEAYTTLGYLAARTTRVELLAWVTAVTYREPGMLAKLVSTLDVLSKGRAWLGIGAAWNDAEAHGLGLPFPPLAERFERLDETLQICRQMWSAADGPFHGRHYRLERTLNVPQPLQRPRILIGGGGEKKTLRFVAKYADACNVFAGPDVERKLDVLRGHCEVEGRDYDEIEKTAQLRLDLGERGEHADAFLRQLGELAALGIQAVQGKVPGVWELDRLKIFEREIIPAAAEL
jgi:F420-dependent oxidoreductase-like protein